MEAAVATAVDIDYVSETQNVDAAIYLLGRMIGAAPDDKRGMLELMLKRIRRTRELRDEDPEKIATLYQELMA